MKKIMPLLIVAALISVNSHSQEKKVGDSVGAIKDTTFLIDTSKVYTNVQIQAIFPGGNDKWNKYLESNLNINIPLGNNAPNGDYIVTLRFIVNINGRVTDVVAENDPGYGMAEEAIRIIKKGPKWSPGIKNGIQVKSYRRQKIPFHVSKE